MWITKPTNRISSRLFGKFTAEQLAAMSPQMLRVELDLIEREVFDQIERVPIPVAAVAPRIDTEPIPIYSAIFPAEYLVVDEPTEFNVVLTGMQPAASKFSIMQAIRDLSSYNLFETKELVDKSINTGKAVFKEGLSKEDAEQIKTRLERAGAFVVIEGCAI